MDGDAAYKVSDRVYSASSCFYQYMLLYTCMPYIMYAHKQAFSPTVGDELLINTFSRQYESVV